MNNNGDFLYLNDNYDDLKLEDLEENNVSVQSIPLEHLDEKLNYINNNNINFPYNNLNLEEGPIKLIEFDKNNFKLNPLALDILRSIEEQIIVVSIVGKARTGKSYLMNLLLNTNNNNKLNKGFKVSSSINSCTRGIWLWNTPRQKPNSSAKIIFIDSEGTNSVDLSTKTYDSKIFSLIILLSSLFIYNTNGNIDEQSISELALSTYLSNSIAINSNSYIDKDKLIRDLAPKFIWTLRDFSLDKINNETGEEISSDEYLELYLRNKSSGKNSKQNDLIRENIIKYFKERECITLPRPIDEEKDLQNLNNIPFSELKSNFRTEFLILKNKVYETSKPKILNGKKITGPILADLLYSFINSINSGIVPNINTACDNIILNEIQIVYENCKNIWKTNIENNNDNINIKLLYDLKYIVISEYNNVIRNNVEIKYNKIFYNKFNDYKNKLDKDLQREINKIISNINEKNYSHNKDIINKNKNIIYSNIYKKIYEKNDNKLIVDYNNFLNNINNNLEKDYKDTFNLICKTELNITKDMLLYIIDKKQYEINQQKVNTEKEIKINAIDILSEEDTFNRLKNLNKELNDKFNYLENDLNNKNKELMHLIGKYTLLIEKRDELIKDKDKSLYNGGSFRNNVTMKNSKLRNSVSQLYYDVDTKACGCQFNDDICNIF